MADIHKLKISKEQTSVGIFIFLGLLLAAVSIILVGGDRMFFKKFYTLKVNFSQIQGLGKGGVVSLSGITVGNVKNMSVSHTNRSIELELDIDVEYRELITANSKASIRTQGALGDKYIYIEPGEYSAKALIENDYIPSDESGDIMEMIMEKGSELTQVVNAVAELQKIFEQLSADGRMGSIAQNLDQLLVESHLLVRDLRGTQGQDNLKQGLAHINSILDKIDNSQGTLGALINDPTLHKKLVRFLGGSKRNQYLKPLIRETIKSQETVQGQ